MDAAEAVHDYDDLVTKAVDLIRNEGGATARTKMVEGFLSAPLADRDRARALAAMAAEGVVREAQRELRQQSGEMRTTA